jgi:hypothetical protein
MPDDILQSLPQMGVAGLMGVLWVWERMFSRRREQELTEAHDRLMRQQQEVGVVVELVRRNTEAFERFGQTHQQLVKLLEELKEEMRGHRS